MNESRGLFIAVLSSIPEDVAFINSTLRDAGHAAHCQQINDSEAFIRFLEVDSLDLIILNQEEYPDPIEQVIEERDVFRPEIPLIALQKSIDEASIQKAIKAGANDLVSIESKSRLQAVVARELRTLRMERALNRTLSSATVYKRQIDDYMQYGAAAIAYVRDGIVADANKAWLNLFEIGDKSEMLGQPVMDYFAAESQAVVKGALVATVQGKWRENEHLSARSRPGGSASPELKLELELVELNDGPHVLIRTTTSTPDEALSKGTDNQSLKADPGSVLFDRDETVEKLRIQLQHKPRSGLQILAYIKPDHFSKLRRNVGILKTDEVLHQFRGEVCGLLCPDDVAGEFEDTAVLALLERGNERDAVKWAKILVDKIEGKVFRAADQTITLTCTVGLCAVSGAFSSLEELLGAADDALSQGRAKGGNLVFLDAAAEANARILDYDDIWVGHIKSAFADNRFRLAQLPIAGLRSDDARMFDMLLRMLDEKGNEILPSEFLPSAQRNDLMNIVDRWVIDAAMQYCANSSVDRAFIRLSRQSILDATLPGWVKQRIDGHQIEASNLCFQVPAEDAAKYVQQCQDLVDQLKSSGSYFALEHYGIDHHSDRLLDLLKPNYMKIDGELMRTLASDSKSQASVKKLVSAAAQRSIDTVAERVENPATMAVLFQLGVNFMQGHYVHEPEIILQQMG